VPFLVVLQVLWVLPPRWFYMVLAACAAILTAGALALAVSAALHFRWIHRGDVHVDTWRSAICSLESGKCIPLPHHTVSDSALSRARAWLNR
jgi:hypothetical protein